MATNNNNNNNPRFKNRLGDLNADYNTNPPNPPNPLNPSNLLNRPSASNSPNPPSSLNPLSPPSPLHLSNPCLYPPNPRFKDSPKNNTYLLQNNTNQSF